ncbi:MAG: hypothetical protein LUD79_02810 [Oscillospiraceae bacterium]|nr:hypothetical protein [Oscillospiraceae bacterium]
MADWLTALLRQTQEQEEAVGAMLNTLRREQLTSPAAKRTEGEEAEGQSPSPAPTLGEQAQAVLADLLQQEGAASLLSRRDSIPSAEEGSGSVRNEASTGSPGQSSRKNLSADRAISTGTTYVRLSAAAGSRTAAPDVSSIDRILERDARRYDSGFRLY